MTGRIKSGSTLLDLILGGGYGADRMIRIAGDPSTGKTQLAISAAGMFKKQYPDGKIGYLDAECAFDVPYALRLGLPEEDVKFFEAATVEEWGDIFEKFIDDLKPGEKGLFILDSLDILATADAAGKKISEQAGHEAGRRAQVIGHVLKRAVGKMEEKDVCFICICQTRDNVSGYGPAKIVGGGKAVFFLSSQSLMLKVIDKLKKTVDKVEHTYGVTVEAYCDKNKLGIPFKKCQYTIIFNHGLDDTGSCLEWLESVGQLDLLPTELLPPSVVESNKTKKKEKDEDGEVGEDGKKKKKESSKVRLIKDRIAAMDDPKERAEMVAQIKKTATTFFNSNHEKVDEAISQHFFD